MKTALASWFIAAAIIAGHGNAAPQPWQTRHAGIQVDDKGFITSLTNRRTGKEYVPGGRPSPILSLHESGQPNDFMLEPRAAAFRPDKGEIVLSYANGAVAVVRAVVKDDYLRFQLVSLTPRDTVDIVVWGPLKTSISGKMGDIIGVVRDPDFAIGMMGLDDNTISGPITDGDSYYMAYFIHSPDPVKSPVPPPYKEGQIFNIGGDGVNDVAFYSHPELYFQMFFGIGAKLEPAFGSMIACYARDRRRSYVHNYALVGVNNFHPRHMVSDPVKGVDFIGSGVALYACPDDLGLTTIEKIILAEGLPHPVIDGKWVRDPSRITPQILWQGPYDKLAEYGKAMGIKRFWRDTGEYYANPMPGHMWRGRVGFADGHSLSDKEFNDLTVKDGVSHGGLHHMMMFANLAADTPLEHLQTICRTKLAKDISATDTEIIVTEPSFLAEQGVWTRGDKSGNFLRIGSEILSYESISKTMPWTLKIKQRGCWTKPQAHKAGDETAKLMQSCYGNFVPDMEWMLDWADHYAAIMVENGMEVQGFDGFESCVYQNHGAYAHRVFMRRLFATYAKLTGGKTPLISGSCVFPGAWEYMDSCYLGGDRGYNFMNNTWGTQGKDLNTGFTNSYYTGTMGAYHWSSSWSPYDVENMQAKSIGMDAGYALYMHPDNVERMADKDECLNAFRTWQEARFAGVFTPELKKKLRDPSFKAHLEPTGKNTFTLYQVKETRAPYDATANPTDVPIANAQAAQPLRFWLQADCVSNGAELTLPGGEVLKLDRMIERLQYIICTGERAYLADVNRNKIADIPLPHPVQFPKGDSKIGVKFMIDGQAKIRFALTTRVFDQGEKIGRPN